VSISQGLSGEKKELVNMKIIKIAQDVPVEEHQYDKMDKDKKEKIKLHLKFGEEDGLTLSEIATAVNIEKKKVHNYLGAWWNGIRKRPGEKAKRGSELTLSQAFPHLGRTQMLQDKKDKIISYLNEGSHEGLSLDEIAIEVDAERKKVYNYLRAWWNGNKQIPGEKGKRGSELTLNQAFPHLGYTNMPEDKKDKIISYLNEGSHEGLSLDEIAIEVDAERNKVYSCLKSWWNGKKEFPGEKAKRGSELTLSQAFPHLGRTQMLQDKKDKIISYLNEGSHEGLSLDEIAIEVNIERNIVYNYLQSWSRNEKRTLGRDFPHLFDQSRARPSVHTEGGESRSWHEVVIRDIFFFTGTNFIYEPPNWTNLSFVKEFKHKCFGEAKTYNDNYLAKKQEEDPSFVMPSTPYQTTYPQPDFLINDILFEVFGGSREMDKYEIRMGFKKEKFTEFFSNHFAYIDQGSLDSAALNDRTLVAYATALDEKVEGAKSSIGNQFQSKLETIAPLLGENNIHLNVNYRTQISSFSEDERISTKYNVDIYNHGEYPTDKDVNAPIPIAIGQLPKAIAPEQTETATDQAVASNDSWYKLAQSSGYNRTEPASMNEISSALKQEGFWSSHRWSENDRIAMYFKTPENLQMALSKLQQPIMEFPQQEQQIAAFNLSRMKK
jgi:predicted DNA-binding protein YlxM (UPF0122 family)